MHTTHKYMHRDVGSTNGKKTKRKSVNLKPKNFSCSWYDMVLRVYSAAHFMSESKASEATLCMRVYAHNCILECE